MKKTLSAVLAMLMILSCFAFTGTSVLASEEYPMVYKNVANSADLFTASVDYVRAETTVGTYHGVQSTRFDPIRVETINKGNNGNRAEQDVSKMGQTVEGYGRIPLNNSVSENANKLDYRVYKYLAVKYYYEVTHENEPSATQMVWRTMNSGKPEGTSAPANVISSELVTNKWAYAYFDLGSVAKDTAYFCMQYHFDYMAKDGAAITGRAIPEGEVMYLEGCYYATSMDELPVMVDEYLGAEDVDATATGATVEEVEFVKGDAFAVTPGAAAGATLTFNVKINDASKTPNLEIDYYMYASADQTVDAKPVVVIGGREIEAADAITANKWETARFDITPEEVATLEATTEITLYPYGKTFVPAANNKMYIQRIALLENATTVDNVYSAPDLDENGDIKIYEYVDPEGGAVAYYGIGGSYEGIDPAGSTSVAPYGSLTKAVQALDKVGGGTLVLLSDIGLIDSKTTEKEAVAGKTDTDAKPNKGPEELMYFRFPEHKNMIKLRGTPDKRATVWCWAQSNINGPTWFQEYIKFDSQDHDGDDGIYFRGKKGIFGMPGGDYDDVIFGQTNGSLCVIGGADGGTFDQIDLTFYSGQGPRQLRTAGAYGGSNVKGDITLNLYEVDFATTTFKFSHGGGTAKNNFAGDFIINIYGGAKFKSGQVMNEGGTDVVVGGDFIVNVYGKQSAGSLGTINKATIGGNKILNIVEAPTVSINETPYNMILKVTSEQTGNEAAITAGLAAVSEGTTDTVTYGGVIKAVDAGLTVEADYTETAHKAPLVYTGTTLTIKEGVEFTLNGDVTFKDITIVMENGASINSGDFAVTYENTVKFEGSGKLVGTDFEVEKNDADFTVDAAKLNTVAADFTTLIALESVNVVAVNEPIRFPVDITDDIKAGSVVYYITNVDGATTVDGAMTISDGTNTVTLDGLAVNEWGNASFDATVFNGATVLTFTPASLPDGFYLYIHSINFAENSIGYGLDYGAVETDRNGQVIYPVADITVPSLNWLEADADGLYAEEWIFNDANVTVLGYDSEAASAAPYVEYALDAEVDSEWQPYVKVEYYLHTKGDIETPGKMAIEVGGVSVEAEQVITTDASVIATFDLSTLAEAVTFDTIKLYPYGKAATVYTDVNKLYLGNTVISQTKNTTVPEYAEQKFDSMGYVVPTMDDYIVKGEYLANVDSNGIEVTLEDFVAGQALLLAPMAAQTEYSLTLPVIIDNTEWTPFFEVDFYSHNPGVESISDVTPVIEFVDAEGNPQVVEASSDLIANAWQRVSFDLSAYLQTAIYEVKFYPFGNNVEAFAPATTDKIYLQQYSVSAQANTAELTYKAPKLDEDGLLIPYSFTPDDGKAVVYVSKNGYYTGSYLGSTDSTKAYATLDAAFEALKGVGGYIIVLDDINYFGDLELNNNNKKWKYKTKNLPAHEDMIIIRGKDVEEGEEKVQLAVSHMAATNGPTTFENIKLRNQKYNLETDEELGGNDDPLFNSADYLTVYGKLGVENDVEFIDFAWVTGRNIVANSANMPGIRMINWSSGSTDVSDVNFVFNGGTFKLVKGAHVGGGSLTIDGDLNITINGGTFNGNVTPIGTSGDNKTTVNGNINIDINGGTFNGTVSIGSVNGSNVIGEAIVDIVDHPDKGTVLDKISKETFDVIIKNYVKKSGEAVVEGVNEVIDGSTATVSYGGTLEAIDDGLTVSADTVEPAHGAKITYTGTKLTIAAGATLTLGGPVEFKDIEIVTGEGSVIDTGDYEVTFANTAVITGAGKIVGTAFDIEANDDDVTITAADINSADKKNTTLIDLANTQVVLFNEIKGVKVRASLADTITSGNVVYYITNVEGATSVDGTISIVDNGDVAVELGDLVVNEWGTASFDATAMRGAATVTITPPTLPEGYYFYIHSVNFAVNDLSYGLDYGAVETDRNGQIIYPVEDVVIPGASWINRSDVDGIKTSAEFFALGETTMLTYADTTVVAPFIEYRLDEEHDTEWQPYVKVEYYIHANGDEAFDETAKPVIEIGGVKVEAEQVVTVNASAIATFDIASVNQKYTSFKFYPYGEDATGFDSQNKVYMGATLISQTKDETVPEYRIPKINEDGIVIPYSYDPGTGEPVVYYKNGGVYKGDVSGVLNSNYSYGSLSDAFKALDAVGGGILVMLSDYVATSDFPGHKNMIKIRGTDEEGVDVITIDYRGQYSASGPIWLEENLFITSNKGDRGLMAKGNKVVIGVPGGDDDDVVFDHNVGALNITGGGDGGSYNTSPDITFYSGTAPAELRIIGGYSGSSISGDININIYGGNFENTKFKASHGAGSLLGDLNVNIHGGTFKDILNTESGTVTVGGDINFVITGGTFNGTIRSCNTSKVTVGGKRTLDILAYDGSITGIISKVDQSTFDVLYINEIFVSTETGNDENTGLSKSAPVKTLAQARKNLTAVPVGGNPDAEYNGRIVVLDYEFDGTEMASEDAFSGEMFVVGDSADSTITVSEGFFTLQGDTRFKNITFNVTALEEAGIDANSYKLVMDDGVKVTSEAGLTIIGGTKGADITINSGKYDKVYGSVEESTGDSNITINGGEFGDIVSAAETLNGNATIVINDGEFDGTIIGGSENGDVNGEVSIQINGGTFGRNSEIIIANSGEGEVNGDAIATITDGDFSAMDTQAIQSGNSSNKNTEIKLVLNGFNGTGISEKYDSNGLTVINPRPERPTVGGRFVYILEEIVTGRNGLKKAEPFKITQNAAQSGASVVVAPKQLNIKVDGGDQAIMTVQVLGDGVTESIRYAPNHKATKGGTITSDGWNIKGRGVDLTKHKWVEIVYYYTVPEGQEQMGKEMVFRPLGSYSAMGLIKSNALVANKWATAIVELGNLASEKGLSGELGQYHFQPLGALKGEQIPADQYIDILSLTFYTDKPNTVITGGAAPSAIIKVENTGNKPAVPTKPAKIAYDPLVVPGSKLKSTIDKSGAFTAADVQKDGKSVTKIIPTADNDKILGIEGFATIPTTEASPANTIDHRKYRYVVLKYFYETTKDSVIAVPELNICRGGIAADDPDLTKGGVYKAITPIDQIKVNEWTYALFDINPADQTKFKTKQYHLRPYGSTKANAAGGDIVYIENLTFYATLPNLDEQGNVIANVVVGDETEPVEGELTDAEIEAKDPTVVAPAALRYGMGADKTFSSKLTTFEDKQVVAITPNSVSNDVVAIDGTTAVTAENGVISMKNYKYAVISYYFKSAKATATKNPAIELLSIGLRSGEGALGEKTFEAAEPLKTNEWATAVIRLRGTASAYLSKGFILNPFGAMNASSFAAGDTLYIESVTFCTEVE